MHEFPSFGKNCVGVTCRHNIEVLIARDATKNYPTPSRNAECLTKHGMWRRGGKMARFGKGCAFSLDIFYISVFEFGQAILMICN